MSNHPSLLAFTLCACFVALACGDDDPEWLLGRYYPNSDCSGVPYRVYALKAGDTCLTDYPQTCVSGGLRFECVDDQPKLDDFSGLWIKGTMYSDSDCKVSFGWTAFRRTCVFDAVASVHRNYGCVDDGDYSNVFSATCRGGGSSAECGGANCTSNFFTTKDECHHDTYEDTYIKVKDCDFETDRACTVVIALPLAVLAALLVLLL
eukprot:TRINITY_DN8178_c0_g1_i2.p2 TRINITY_DN8178_c0_g1~~TRINITY_DN8178_c0_g1_i2.p2  ORF type:complete len:206 (+),score=64.31 TRINITY_DN8178_c0_g1_i2:127-744(+)